MKLVESKSREFSARLLREKRRNLRVETSQLRGGISAALVAKADVHSPRGRASFVVKQLHAPHSRELEVYRMLDRIDHSASPKLLGYRRVPDGVWLFLEAIHGISEWPWKDYAFARKLMVTLAELHLHPDTPVSTDWNYESELSEAAGELLSFVEERKNDPALAALKDLAGVVRRAVRELPRMRRRLFSYEKFPPTFIHGDVHPGNAMICAKRGARPVLLDWGRARIGSPLEDVASVLQSLRFWEVEARRKHDTLLRDYLQARGMSRVIDNEMHEMYWYAAASTVLAGALDHHLENAVESEGAERERSLEQARDCLRILRRAAIYSRR